jgi:hypothetical protein
MVKGDGKGELHQTYDLISGVGADWGRIEDMKLMILEETHSQPKESDQ